MKVRPGCAPCEGGVFQWVRDPTGRCRTATGTGFTVTDPSINFGFTPTKPAESFHMFSERPGPKRPIDKSVGDVRRVAVLFVARKVNEAISKFASEVPLKLNTETYDSVPAAASTTPGSPKSFGKGIVRDMAFLKAAARQTANATGIRVLNLIFSLFCIELKSTTNHENINLFCIVRCIIGRLHELQANPPEKW